MRTTAILFDLDDTLLVEEASVDEAFLATCEHARERYDIDPEELHQSIRRHARELWHAFPTITYCQSAGISSWEGLWARFLGDYPNMKTLRKWAPTYRREAWTRALANYGVHDSSLVEHLSATFREERNSRHVLFPETKEVLRELQSAYRLALVTNGIPDLQQEKLSKSNLTKYFEVVIISGEIGIGKPDPRIFALALDRLDVKPEMAVMVGNSLARDIVGAQQAGIKAIWINRSEADLREGITPDAQITSLTQLHDIL